jgi:hypothetical protein
MGTLRTTSLKFWIVLSLHLLASNSTQGQSRFVTTRDGDLVRADGSRLLLRGINLGNWLLPEGYMFKFKSTNSPQRIQTLINQLVGEDEARRFWTKYHQNYITEEDISSSSDPVLIPFVFPLVIDCLSHMTQQ